VCVCVWCVYVCVCVTCHPGNASHIRRRSTQIRYLPGDTIYIYTDTVSPWRYNIHLHRYGISLEIQYTRISYPASQYTDTVSPWRYNIHMFGYIRTCENAHISCIHLHFYMIYAYTYICTSM